VCVLNLNNFWRFFVHKLSSLFQSKNKNKIWREKKIGIE
jgi:hypothetical protein